MTRAGRLMRRAGAAMALSLLVVAAGAARARVGAQAPAPQPGTPRAASTGAPARIVSLVPAATEVLFAIGAGPAVVGVSSFDTYPPEAATRTKVGALVDPDLERIFALRPDLVIAYASQDDLRAQLARAGIPTFDYRHGGLEDVLASVRAIGASAGRAAEAERLAATLTARIARVRAAVRGHGRPRTLLVFGRESATLRNVYASGGVGFLHDMLTAAGGDNVFADVRRESVQATTELILARAPEALIELRYGHPLDASAIARERESWKTLAAVPAVRTGRVHVLVGDEFVVPGPRVADATERLAAALHPDAFQ